VAAPRARSDASEFEEYPTQVQKTPFEDVRSAGEDASTTQRRGPEFAQQVAQARMGVRDTDVTGKPAAANDTDPTGKVVAPPRVARRSSPELRDDQDTIVKSNSAFPIPKRRPPRRPPSPDDTVRVDPEGPSEGDPTQLMAPRAPKSPRRG
jgi:hypothetical protein